jgi:hypothetical protein
VWSKYSVKKKQLNCISVTAAWPIQYMGQLIKMPKYEAIPPPRAYISTPAASDQGRAARNNARMSEAVF